MNIEENIVMRGNMKNMMKQMQQMQKEMEKSQGQLEKKMFTGIANDELVTITMNGKKEVQAVEIKEDIVEMADKEFLEDLIQIALEDVLGKVDKETESVMGKYTQNLNIPGF